MNRGDTWFGGLGRGMHYGLLPTGSEEREVLGLEYEVFWLEHFRLVKIYENYCIILANT